MSAKTKSLKAKRSILLIQIVSIYEEASCEHTWYPLAI